MSSPSINKRAVCPKCEYILQRCLCQFIKTINNQVRIIILMHPSEARHALGSVHIMAKSLQNMDLFVGENFDDHLELNSLIKTHGQSMALMFPTQESLALNSTLEGKITHLIFIDGTWKKARKIFLLSKNLHSLPTYSLPAASESLYKIRKTTVDNGLSTLEAASISLALVEKNLDTSSMVKSFLEMIEFQIKKMGEETFLKNYKKKRSDD